MTSDSVQPDAFYQKVLQHAPFGVVVVYVDGTITYVNDTFTAITGYARTDVPTTQAWIERAYPDPDYRAMVVGNWDVDVAQESAGRDVVYRVTCRDGQQKEIQLRAGHLQRGLMIVMLLDVTAQRRAEARLAGILQAAPIGIGLVDRECILHWVNPVVCRMLGYAEEDLVGQSARMLYVDEAEYRRVGEKKYAEMDRLGVGTVETRWVTRDGGLRDVLLSSVSTDLLGIPGATFTALDITEGKQMDRDRMALRDRMVQMQKLESLGVLAGGIAHDFNNLLLGILGNAEMVLMDLPPGSAVRGSVVEIEDAAQRASELTRQMLAYSGKSRFVVQSVDIRALITGMQQLLRVGISKKARLKIELQADLPEVAGDSAQLRQVLLSLATNASDALGADGGEICISSGVAFCDAEYLSSTFVDDKLEEGDYVFVEVRDTGCGMSHQVHPRIFDPFFTTKFAGRGLGLAATLGIVRGHHGAVKVDSTLGLGTTVRVLLPVGHRGHVVPIPPQGGTSSPRLALLVDDDQTVRRVGERMLQRMGLDVEVAVDGVDALERFARRPQQYSFVLLDLTMPRKDGIETMTELQRIRPGTPVILSSGYSEAEVKERFVQHGFAGLIQKPYRYAELQRLVAQVGQRE